LVLLKNIRRFDTNALGNIADFADLLLSQHPDHKPTMRTQIVTALQNRIKTFEAYTRTYSAKK
jgi:hypothetical protein